jgi:diadenosine tetraphosphate (Ap4A) HIT family hydrolase
MTDCFDPSCQSCEISQGRIAIGGNIKLPGEWSLNHYGGTEGYLGWLALQPICHRMKFSELSPEELRHLGPNISAVQRVLSEYWMRVFADPIERLYIVYFFDGGGPERYHVHLHLIPRFASLESRLRAWDVHRATTSATFPPRYKRDASNFHSQVGCIMDHLRRNLAELTVVER